jgi:Kef-type K+ transport system membrane component KefB
MVENANLLLFLFLSIIITRFSILLRKLGQPSLIGELVGGLIISVLGFYNLKVFHSLPNSQALAFLSELGSIFLLFEIGLESEISMLRQNGMYAIAVAFVGAIISFILGYLFTKYFVPNMTRNFCLFLAATLTATSTGISIRIFKEYGLTRSKACQIVLASSIIDDIISLVTLTIITALTIAGKFNFNSITLIFFKVTFFFVIVYVGIKFLLPIFYRSDNQDNALELAIIIAACVASSWIAHIFGLSSIIGAFIAGLFIDKTRFKEKHYLVYPLVWLFVPIFFIYSGMQIDIASLLNYSTIKLALLFSIVAIISKILPTLLIPYKISFFDKLVIGLGMVPRGEIGLIIAIVGKEKGFINNYYFNVVALMVFITSFMSPILLNQAIKRTSAHKIRGEVTIQLGGFLRFTPYALT